MVGVAIFGKLRGFFQMTFSSFHPCKADGGNTSPPSILLVQAGGDKVLDTLCESNNRGKGAMLGGSEGTGDKKAIKSAEEKE